MAARTCGRKPPEDWEPWKYADFQPKETFETAESSKGADLNDFVRNSQQYQSNINRYVTESLRQLKYGRSTGLYQFMFVDDWPSITWSVVDYYRNPKQGYGRSSRHAACFPQHRVQGDGPGAPLSLIIVNDLHREFPRSTREMDGRRQTVTDKVIDIPADGVVDVASLGAMPAVTTGAQTLRFWIEDAQGKPSWEKTNSTLATSWTGSIEIAGARARDLGGSRLPI